MNNDEFTLTPRAKLIIFAVAVVLSGCGWLAFKLIWRPQVYTPASYAQQLNISLNPVLPTTVVAKMRDARSYTQEELTDYDIYILDKTRGSTDDLHIVKYEPNIPYDRSYQDFKQRYDQERAAARALEDTQL